MSLSVFQFKLLAAIPFVTAPLSFVGSLLIVYIIFRQWKRESGESNQTYARLMLGICAFDIAGSFWTMLGPLPVPNDYEGPPSLQHTYHGTTATCSAQGFFMYLGTTGTLFYNCSLLCYYMMTIIWECSDMDTKKVEVYMHAFSFMIPTILNGVGLGLQIFNPTPLGQRCGITAYPLECVRDPTNVPCTRGTHFDVFVTYFIVVPCIIALSFLLVSLAGITLTVRLRERNLSINSTFSPSQQQTSNNSSSNSKQVNHKNGNQTFRVSKSVTRQSILYGIVFFNTYFWVFFRYFLRRSHNEIFLYTIRFLGELFLPLQGFFNFIIFLMPRYQRVRRFHQHKSTCWLVKESIFGKPIGHTTRRRIHSRRTSSMKFATTTSARSSRGGSSPIGFGDSSKNIERQLQPSSLPDDGHGIAATHHPDGEKNNKHDSNSSKMKKLDSNDLGNAK